MFWSLYSFEHLVGDSSSTAIEILLSYIHRKNKKGSIRKWETVIKKSEMKSLYNDKEVEKIRLLNKKIIAIKVTTLGLGCIFAKKVSEKSASYNVSKIRTTVVFFV